MKRYEIRHTEAIYRWLSENYFTLVVIDYEASEQLRSCQAWMLPFTMKSDIDGDYYHGYLLQSYETIVSFMAVGEKVGDILTVDLGKWSTTTSKQQTWFKREVDQKLERSGWKSYWRTYRH